MTKNSFSAWRAELSGVFNIMGSLEEADEFTGAFDLRATRKFIISSLSATSVRLAPHRERKSTECFAIALPLNGEIQYRARVRSEMAPATGPMFFDFTQDFEIHFSARKNAAELAILWAPRGRMLAVLRDEAFLHGVCLSAETAGGFVVSAALRAFFAQAPRMSDEELDALASGAVAIAAESVNYHLRHAQGATLAPPLDSLLIIRRFINQNLHSPKLDAHMISQAFGLSRASLYRLFEPLGGVASYIRKARLERAYRQISSPHLADRRIGQIAHQAGFSDVSAFNRLFSKAFGMSPSDARAQALSGFQDAYIWTGKENEESALLRCLSQIRY